MANWDHSLNIHTLTETLKKALFAGPHTSNNHNGITDVPIMLYNICLTVSTNIPMYILLRRRGILYRVE